MKRTAIFIIVSHPCDVSDEPYDRLLGVGADILDIIAMTVPPITLDFVGVLAELLTAIIAVVVAVVTDVGILTDEYANASTLLELTLPGPLEE